MAKLLSVEFEFRGNHHYSLIRVQEKEDCKEYKITIMNEDLERLLYGNHILVEVGGRIKDDSDLKNSEQHKLKRAIVKSLTEYLESTSTQS